MIISFEHTDPFMDELNNIPEIIELSSFLYNNPSLIVGFSEIIRGGNTKNQYRQLVVSSLMRNKELIGMVDKLNEAFDLVFKKSGTIACFRGKSEIECLGLLRGSILESLIFKILSERGYVNKDCNCLVKIDGVTQQLPTCPHPQTMDVVGIEKEANPERGELYECKVGLKYINDNDINFVHLLFSNLKNAGLPGVIAGLICLEGNTALKAHITKRLKLKYRHVVCRENLGSLWSYDDLKKLIS